MIPATPQEQTDVQGRLRPEEASVPISAAASPVLSGLEERLLTEPDYRPYCLNCSTMERMSLHEREGRRIMRCEKTPETHYGAIFFAARFGIPPRVGCGLEFDIHTGERLNDVPYSMGTKDGTSEVSSNPEISQ